MKAVCVRYEGRVQGVGFRWTVKNLAQGFDVSGSVQNLPDGRVELVAQGEPAEVDDFLEAIRTSQLAGHIRTELPETLPAQTALRGFQILT